jgi:hypothetical protein
VGAGVGTEETATDETEMEELDELREPALR